MAIRQELLEELLQDYKSPEDLLGQGGLLKELTKALVEKALDGELTHHLGYPKHSSSKNDNARNGKSKKGLLTDHGKMEIVSPRDRNGSFEPELVKKRQTRFDGFDEKILSLYARGMTVREIQGHLEDLYGEEVSPDLISSVTDSVLEEVRLWQNRSLDAVYPIIFHTYWQDELHYCVITLLHLSASVRTSASPGTGPELDTLSALIPHNTPWYSLSFLYNVPGLQVSRSSILQYRLT